MSSVVFGCSNGYFSEMKEFLFERSYCSWRVVDFDVLKDGVLAVREPGSTVEILRVDLHALHKPLAQGCHLSEVPNAIGLEFISKIVPVTSGALDSEAERPHQYRFVLTSRDAVGLLKALKAVLPVLDVSAFPLGITASAPDAVLTLEMQKLAARALNKYSRIMRAVVVRSQRGSFRWLPVACSSDLVLGSWWFVVGSIFSVAITLIVFLNDFELQTEGNAKFQIGNDDSILPQTGYRIAWALCLASSVFFTVGSLAFVRACNVPPLPPLPLCKCIANDELFGMWLFLMAVFPVVPYCFVYLVVSRSYMYLVVMVLSLALVGAMALFIRCYYYSKPKENASKSHILDSIKDWCLPRTRVLGVRAFFVKHMATDFLVATWAVYLGTFIGLWLFLALLFYELYHDKLNNLSKFVYATSAFDGFLFWVGSAYFVAGAYYKPYGEHETDENNLMTAL